jgi:hypothetical protein
VSIAARHAGRVTEDGAVRLRDVARWLRALARQKGREVWLEVHRQREDTSQDQHGYYRAVILPLLAEEWGWGNPAELHRELKLLHLPKIIPVEDWPTRRIGVAWIADPPSMGDMSKEQSSAFLQAVLDQAADAGISVPPPRGSGEAL